MIVRCPACGAEASLDALIDNDAAAEALNAALALHPCGKLLVRYLALFRPAKSKLSWPRVASILGELLPQIAAQRIERDGRVHNAPLEVWASALDKTIAARDAGTLRTPLKSHGYLLEIAVAEAARLGVGGAVLARDVPAGCVIVGNSATAKALNALESRRRPTT
jgi:hypothetical protein